VLSYLFATSNRQVSIGVCLLSLICYAYIDNINLIILIHLALRLHLFIHLCIYSFIHACMHACLVVSCTQADEEDSSVDWNQVSRHIGNRSEKQCHVRWNTLLKYRGNTGTRRGGWSAEEDSRLMDAIRRNERKGGGIF
jgi:hypothetical protein